MADVEIISVVIRIDFLNIETSQATNYISLAPPFDNHLALVAVSDFNFLSVPLRNPRYSLRLALMPGQINRRGESEVFAEDAESNFMRTLLW